MRKQENAAVKPPARGGKMWLERWWDAGGGDRRWREGIMVISRCVWEVNEYNSYQSDESRGKWSS